MVFPSDTVYGLAVDATNLRAVTKLLAFKNKWQGKAISVAVADKKMALNYINDNATIERVFETLLPGPFTVIARGKHRLAKGVEAEDGTLGIRWPENELMNRLAKELGKPITATSANMSGKTPNYSVNAFIKTLSKKKGEMIDLIIDGGKLVKNKPSTVINAIESEIKVLRRGELITEKTNSLLSTSPEETEKIATFLLDRSTVGQNPDPIIFLLTGDLGGGKTVFSRGIGKKIGVAEAITSPTFVIENEYKISPKSKKSESRKVNKFLHFDLYRITNGFEFEELKFLEQFKDGTIACIEWPENMGKNNLDELRRIAKIVTVKFEYKDETTREISYELNNPE